MCFKFERDYNVPIAGKVRPKYDSCAWNKLCSKITCPLFYLFSSEIRHFKCHVKPDMHSSSSVLLEKGTALILY